MKESVSLPTPQSDEDGAVFSPAIEVVEADGNGIQIVAGYDWRVETLDNGTRRSIIHDRYVI